jgi:hypothetical protein
MVFVESASMHVRYKDLPHLILQAMEEKIVPASIQSNASPKE